jgi:hypothetical protein
MANSLGVGGSLAGQLHQVTGVYELGLSTGDKRADGIADVKSVRFAFSPQCQVRLNLWSAKGLLLSLENLQDAVVKTRLLGHSHVDPL